MIDFKASDLTVYRKMLEQAGIVSRTSRSWHPGHQHDTYDVSVVIGCTVAIHRFHVDSGELLEVDCYG